MARYLFIFILISFVVFGCSDDDLVFEIGEKYVDENMQILFTDTLSVRSYTVKWDSLITSGYNIFLTGKYRDSVFGNTYCRSFVDVKLPLVTTPIPNDAVYDSLHFILVYTGYSLGDTTQPQVIRVHRLEEKLDEGEGNELYNTSSFAYDPDPYGQVVFRSRPTGRDSVIIRLSDDLGQEMFYAFKNKSEIVSEQGIFENYLKGFVIDYDESNESVLAFHAADTIPLMRLFYHYTDLDVVHKKIEFVLYDSDLQFNQIRSTDTGFELPERQKDKLPAQETGNTTYLQAGTGIFTRIEIPYLKNILELSSNLEVLHAELILEPLSNSYSRKSLPMEISAYDTDNGNNFVTPLRDEFENLQIANLTIDDIFFENTRYRFDVTDFINGKLVKQTDDVPSLLVTISPNQVFYSIDKLILGSSRHYRNDVRLEIYYMRYE
ncbi:MAG: DUF4270 family protein [Bacteroidales bacterium]|nr:DUF4270 family protein [Bacteroidales bacterium]